MGKIEYRYFSECAQFSWKKKHEFHFFYRKVFLLSSLIFLFTKLSLIYQSQLQVELVQTLLWSISDTERYFWAKSFKFILAMYIGYIPLMNWTLTENCSYWRGENKYIFMSKFVTLTDFMISIIFPNLETIANYKH